MTKKKAITIKTLGDDGTPIMLTNVINFSDSVINIKMLDEGGLRITLDLPEDGITQAMALYDCKREQIPIYAMYILKNAFLSLSKTNTGTV